MFKKTTCWITLLYGLLLAYLGITGYVRKESLISLYVGGGLGLIIVISALLLFARKKTGIYISVFATLIITATFAVRYTITHHTIPALLCVLSGGMLIFLLAQSVKWKHTND